MRKGFTKQNLEEMFKKIGNSIKTDVEVFLLGGGAMCFRNQKNATKDLDLVFEDETQMNSFVDAIKKLGFTEPRKIEVAYKEMAVESIWENNGGFRLDIFLKTVCGGLSISKGMMERSSLLVKYGKLSVKILSNEEIILFKSITERPGDADDIAAIIRNADIHWEIILEECVHQSKTKAWYGSVQNKLIEIEEKHGITAPISVKIEELYHKVLLKEAYETRMEKGMKREEIVKELKAIGFTQKEIDDIF